MSRFFRTGKCGPALAREILENEEGRNGTDYREKQAGGETVKDHVADGEKGGVDHDYSGEPIGEVG